MQNFSLTDKQIEKIEVWEAALNQKTISKQKADIAKDHSSYDLYRYCWESGFPYTGAVGGSLTYSFTPTSLGPVVTVEHILTKETFDVTDYDNF